VRASERGGAEVRASERGGAEVRASERGSAEVRAGLALHRVSLTAHARKLARNAADAEDLVQDTALRALSFASSFEPGSNVRAWLHQILHSVFVTRCRRRGRERRGVEALAIDPCAWVRSEPPPVLAELSPRVERALMDLPSGFRDAVRLVDVLDLSYKDAARSLSVPLGTVMSRLHRGRRLLATVLSDPTETENKAA
jgi:RNA polymerase sigma-70 factor (ECF subfamily)